MSKDKNKNEIEVYNSDPKFKEPGFLDYLAKIRLIATQESGNDYNPVQQKGPDGKPVSTAKGKYQYLWDTWSDDIKKKAKEWGEDIKTPEDFLANGRFQERFFEWDHRNKYEEALKLSDNKLNLSVAEVGALMHFQGETKAKEVIKSGKLPKATATNPAASDYINKFRKIVKDAGITDDPYRAKNLARATGGRTTEKERKEILKRHEEELDKINKTTTDPLVRKQLKDNWLQEQYKQGNIEILNIHIDYRNSYKRYKDLLSNKAPLLRNGEQASLPKGALTDKEWNEYQKLEKQLKDQLKKKKREAFGKKVLSEEDKKLLKEQELTIDREFASVITEEEKNIKFQNLDRYNLDDFKVEQELIPVEPEETNTTDNSGEAIVGGGPGSGTKTVTPEPPKVMKITDPLDELDSEFDMTNTKFEYEKGNYQFPFEALASAAMGVAGMKAANTKIPMRDERVSAAMLNYASDLQKISKIGLPPEIEGDLKNKLASAYQTGLTNIVRASAGNRNLVLGNQGQLDQARMKGIVDIAVLDVDRRDKAMAAYGDVMRYINDFDANRDIANNERKYTEAKTKQAMGMDVAAKGFSKLIENIEYQKEFGPGSYNDMMSQAWLTSIYGYNPNAKDDGTGTKPGTKSYADALVEKNKKASTEKETYRNFLLGLTPEQRQEVAKMQEQNPSLNPIRNKDGFQANAIIEAFNKTKPEEEKIPTNQEQVNANVTNSEQNKTVSSSDVPPIITQSQEGVYIDNPSDDSSSGYADKSYVPPGPNVNPLNPVQQAWQKSSWPKQQPAQTPEDKSYLEAMKEAKAAIDQHQKANIEFGKYFNQEN